jgi:hypothetical protein
MEHPDPGLGEADAGSAVSIFSIAPAGVSLEAPGASRAFQLHP